jgi:phosphatidylglycerol:prolipoprotein diacylglycerol transferase
MIPYWPRPHWYLGPFPISVPLALAAAGVLIAHFLFLRRARSQGLEVERAAAMSFTMVLVGAVAAYWFRGVYLSDAVKQDWRTLLHLQVGAASFGGIAGGLLAGWLFLTLYRLPLSMKRRYLDALAFVFPLGWIVGRSGCVVAHDHPGIKTSFFLAVQYPSGTRFDLAVIEVLFLALILIPLFRYLDRRKYPEGFWLGLLLALYGAFRVCLDQLHEDPPRYGPFSVDQWAYGTTLLFGLLLLSAVRSRARVK